MYVLEPWFQIEIKRNILISQYVTQKCKKFLNPVLSQKICFWWFPALILSVLSYNLIQVFICPQGSFPSREASFLSSRLRCITDMSWSMQTRTNSGGPYLQGCEDGKDRPYRYLTPGNTCKKEAFRPRKVSERPPCDRKWIMSPSLAAHW